MDMRTLVRSLFLAGLLCASAAAQQAYEQIKESNLKADVSFLSAEEMAGRKTTSHEARIAANYIASEFLRLGLKPQGDGGSYFQGYDLDLAAQDDANTSLTVRSGAQEKSYQLNHDFDLTWITQTTNPTTATGPVVFIGYGVKAPEYNYDDLANIDLRGKIVIILTHEPQESDPASKFKGRWHTYHAYDQYKYEDIRRAGAAGILEVIETKQHRPQAVPSAPRQDWFPDAIYSLPGFWDFPVFEITEDVANELLQSSGKTIDDLRKAIDSGPKPQSFALSGVTATLKKSYTNRKVVQARNVVGLLEGSDPKLKDEYVIVSAHYDHLGIVAGRTQFGADDNASGVAALLEIARAFAQNPVKPRRSVLFISFDSEEAGLLGSFYYARHPVLPLGEAAAVLNMDMIGRNEDTATWKLAPAFTAQSANLVGTLYSPTLRKIAERQNEKLHLNLDFKTDSEDKEEWFARSDQYVFATNSIPVILFNTGEHPDYHTENDTWDRLNYPKLYKIARLVYLVADDVANRDARPEFDSH
jgi:Zn-dependent M28 family amino/carboxypeptidase